MTLQPGTRLGHYEITSLLGSGGMGEVYRAKDHKLGRDVAIKVLRQELASDPERLRRFEQEARSASALNHPNIITIHDIGKHESTPYIAMEFVEGKTLREILSEGPLPTKKLLQLATQIVEGLAKAHSAGIIHRDLKPENLMVTSDGYVKILDFGLAKLMPDAVDYGSEEATVSRELTRAGVILGTVGYMSPEQASGRQLDHRSDQFSFGSILYEMATGKIAFKRETAAQMLAAIIEGEAEPIAKVNPNVPPHLRVIVERCLEKHPEERYESTRDLARELEGLREIPFALPAMLTRRTVLAGVFSLMVLGIVLLVGLNVGGLRDRLLGGTTPIDSLAVLPLANQSGDPEQEYFVDGITEAIITDLAKISALKVISRNSAMRYKDTDKSIPEIAEELGVDAVVEGSVLRSGNKVRVTAQLIEASTDQYLWAENFEREMRDLMTIYSDVAQAIAQEIEIAVTPAEETRLASVRPVNPEAHVAYLKARSFLNKLTPEGIEKGLAYMQEAIDKDPTNPLPHAGLALAYCIIGHGPSPPPDAFARARAAALEAEELGGALAETEVALGQISLMVDWDWASAEQAFQRALALNPSLPDAHRIYSFYLLLAGQGDEALAEMKRAIEVDPLTPLWSSDLGWQYWTAGRYEEAMDAVQKSLELDPNFNQSLGILGDLYAHKGMYEEAVSVHQKLSKLNPAQRWPLVRTYVLAGRRDEARKMLDRLLVEEPKPTGAGGGFFLVGIYAALGEKDEAFRWLEAAFEERHNFMPWFHLFPELAPLHSDPRFQDLLRRMNFPE